MNWINRKSVNQLALLRRNLTVAALIGSLAVFLVPSVSFASKDVKVDVAKQLYANFAAGDMAKIMSLFSPDVTLTFHGPQEIIPYAGTFKGKDGVMDFFARIDQTIEVKAIDQRLFSVEGDVVSVMGWEESIVKSTGGRFKANWMHVITINNGLITHFEEITDSATIVEALAPADISRGEAYYTTCLGCHGLQGEGMASMHAPRLTLQGSKYLARQLRNFRHDIRGGVQDFYGWQMNGRAKALVSDRAIRDVLAYIGTFPDTHAEDRVDGDISRGAEIYQRNCTACHGDGALGNDALNAPQLAGLDGWYQIEQMTKFSSGLRGSHTDDVIGQTMQASIKTLNGEQDFRDVTAYILSIKSK